jgi:hypothetical protein
MYTSQLAGFSYVWTHLGRDPVAKGRSTLRPRNRHLEEPVIFNTQGYPRAQKSSLVLTHAGNTSTAVASVIDQYSSQSLRFHDAGNARAGPKAFAPGDIEKTGMAGLTTEDTFFINADKRLKR